IGVMPAPHIDSIPLKSLLLLGDTVKLMAAGKNLSGAVFSWAGPNGYTSSDSTPVIIGNPSASGLYRLKVSNSCSADSLGINILFKAFVSGRIVSPLHT